MISEVYTLRQVAHCENPKAFSYTVPPTSPHVEKHYVHPFDAIPNSKKQQQQEKGIQSPFLQQVQKFHYNRRREFSD